MLVAPCNGMQAPHAQPPPLPPSPRPPYRSTPPRYEWRLPSYEPVLSPYESGLRRYELGLSPYGPGPRRYNGGEERYTPGLSPYRLGPASYEGRRRPYQRHWAPYRRAPRPYEWAPTPDNGEAPGGGLHHGTPSRGSITGLCHRAVPLFGAVQTAKTSDPRGKMCAWGTFWISAVVETSDMPGTRPPACGACASPHRSPV